MKQMRIVFLLPVLSQARFHKRIGILSKLGVKPKILAFERDYYPSRPISGGYESLGRISHERYLRRLLSLVRALPKVRVALKGADAIHAFGLDMLLLSWLGSRGCRHLKIVYEVADVREVLLGRRLMPRFLRCLERFLLRRTHLLVVTSEAFVTEYFRRIQGLAELRYQVIENKLDPNALRQIEHKPLDRSSEALRIGYFGLIRCQRSWEILKLAARKGAGKIEVYVRGIPFGAGNLEEEAEAIPSHIEYAGPYVSPNDLPGMYRQVDMVWMITQYHQGRTGNLTWARTNRFYEACFFHRAMIAQVGTQDGGVVNDLGLGICLDLIDIEDAVERILGIGDSDLERWRGNIRQLPMDIYTYTDEHKRLLEFLEQ